MHDSHFPKGLQAVSGGECFEEGGVRMETLRGGLAFSGAGGSPLNLGAVTPSRHSPFRRMNVTYSPQGSFPPSGHNVRLRNFLSAYGNIWILKNKTPGS